MRIELNIKENNSVVSPCNIIKKYSHLLYYLY